MLSATQLFTFVEQQEERTRAARELLIPLLQLQNPEDPWNAQALRSLWAQRLHHEEVLQQAIDHLYRFELPLLEYEESLGHASTEAFAEAMADFEDRFWQERFSQANPQNLQRWLCPKHQLSETPLRELTLRGLYDPQTLATALGVSLSCPDCHRAISRIALEDLKKAKASKEIA